MKETKENKVINVTNLGEKHYSNTNQLILYS